ncbi:hypothetical protein A2U01_0074295, partial [Trifolium medium]|nr:hypothetical protein [Trifolium medium]
MGYWESNRWVWQFQWTEALSVIDAVSAQELMLLLQQVRPCADSIDRRKWSPGTA